MSERKKKKWSRGAKLSMLTGCLVLVMGGYLLTAKMVERAEEKEAEASQIPFVSADAESLTTLTWSCEGETYALQRNDEGSWEWTEDEEFPVNQTTVSYMEYALSEISATRALTGVTDFAQYGLDEPQSVISFAASDGTTVQILTGDYNDVSSEYYAQIAGEDTVYLVSGDYMEDFQYTMEDLLQTESLPIYEADTELRVTENGKTTVYDLTESAEETDSDSDAEEEDSGEDTDTASAQDIADGVRGLNFETCVNYKAKKADLAAYGLDEPQRSFTIKGKQTAEDGSEETLQFTLQVGSKTGSSYYVRLKGSRMIYTVSAEEIEALTL